MERLLPKHKRIDFPKAKASLPAVSNKGPPPDSANLAHSYGQRDYYTVGVFVASGPGPGEYQAAPVQQPSNKMFDIFIFCQSKQQKKLQWSTKRHTLSKILQVKLSPTFPSELSPSGKPSCENLITFLCFVGKVGIPLNFLWTSLKK